MRFLFLTLLSVFFVTKTAYSAVSYSSIPTKLPMEKKQVKEHKKKYKRLKYKPEELKTDSRSKGYLIFGVIYSSLFLISLILLLAFYPMFFLGFLIACIMCFVMGIGCILVGLHFGNRNNNWNSDYE